MRRPNRNIEVFDISLMAVVTKAMGAFLVLMLLLMPHYSSNPLGEKNAAELAKAVSEAEARLKTLQERLSQASQDPAELRRLLEEARQQLAEAQKLVTRLRNDNDALNSQVRRLEAQEQSLRKEIAQLEGKNEDLEKKLAAEQKIAIAGQLLNWDCFDVALTAGLLGKEAFVETKDAGKSMYVLNHGPSFGLTDTVTDDEILSKFSHQVANQPGRGLRFNQSTFFYRANQGKYFVVILARSKSETMIRGQKGRLLKTPAKDCRVVWSMQYFSPRANYYTSFYTTELTIQSGTYAIVPLEVVVKEDKLENLAASEESLTWLRDQIANADKEVAAAPAASAKQTLEKDDLQRLRQKSEEARRKYLEEKASK